MMLEVYMFSRSRRIGVSDCLASYEIECWLYEEYCIAKPVAGLFREQLTRRVNVADSPRSPFSLHEDWKQCSLDS
jgi:hypothetical protein